MAPNLRQTNLGAGRPCGAATCVIASSAVPALNRGRATRRCACFRRAGTKGERSTADKAVILHPMSQHLDGSG